MKAGARFFVLWSLVGGPVQGFQFSPTRRTTSCTSHSLCHLPRNDGRSLATEFTLFEQKPTKYSREVMLREEAAAPFRKVRFFFYLALGAGALTSLAVSVARIAAGLAGINADLLQESSINAAVDVGGLIVLGFAYQRDMAAQESSYQRATKGAELAKLRIRPPPGMLDELTTTDATTLSLADLRRGRGLEKRVVIAAAGADKVQQILTEARLLQNELQESDIVLVPLVSPQGVAPEVVADDWPASVALPSGNGWQTLLNDETAQAIQQGIDVQKDGICVILKKNGRVGQRTRGVFLANMVGDVARRRESGMDVLNI